MKTFKKSETFGQEGDWQIDPYILKEIKNKAREMGLDSELEEEIIDDIIVVFEKLEYVKIE